MTDIASLRMYVRYDEGEGPPMVLLHGINSTAEDWRKVIDTIGGGYRFIAPDLLGFGESPMPTDIEYNSDELSLVLDNTLADLGVTEPFLLVGYSLGGDIAIRYAATYPSKVRRLFLLSAPFYLPPTAFDRERFGTQYLQVIVFQRLWKWVARSQKRDNLLYQIVDGRAEEFAKGFLHTSDVPTSWDIMGKNLRNCIAKATFVNDLPKLDMPVTFALGIRDPIVHPDQTPDLKRLKPTIDVRRIVGLSADHFMLMNLPETVAHEIMRDEITGLAVRYRAGEGKGEPTVFLHGIAEDPGFWRPVASGLSSRREVAMLDLLGFGESMVPLSSLYTMADHVAAVTRTLLREFPGQAVHLVGHGFGADVALSVAAAHPALVADVVAFSPEFVAPAGQRTVASQNEIAAVTAIRDRMNEMVGSPRTRVSAEHAEDRVVPTLRTLDNAVLPADAGEILARVRAPVTAVLPTGDSALDREYLQGVFGKHEGARVLEPDDDRWLPIDDPAAAVLLLDPGATDAAKAAAAVPRPKPQSGLRLVSDAFASTSNNVLLRGVGMLALGLWLLLTPHISERLIATAFAIWVLVEGVSTVAGAFGLRRIGTSTWVAWLLIGVVSFAVAALLMVNTSLNLLILAIVIGIRALYVGIADLYVVARVRRTPAQRWLLVLEGVLGVAIAVFLLVDPHISARLLKLVLGIYFAGVGITSIAYALSTRHVMRQRMRDAVAAQSQIGASAR